MKPESAARASSAQAQLLPPTTPCSHPSRTPGPLSCLRCFGWTLCVSPLYARHRGVRVCVFSVCVGLTHSLPPLPPPPQLLLSPPPFLSLTHTHTLSPPPPPSCVKFDSETANAGERPTISVAVAVTATVAWAGPVAQRPVRRINAASLQSGSGPCPSPSDGPKPASATCQTAA
jgi:hypothetical protein